MSDGSIKNHRNSLEWHKTSCFITGTDTGVGKTMVTGGLALAMQSRHHTVGIMKPVETGLKLLSHQRESDGAQLYTISSHQEPMELTSPYRFQTAMAPLAASRQEHAPIDISRVVAAHTHLLQHNNYVIVEGVGGVMVPLTVDSDVRDLIQTLRCPSIIVSQAFLGAINHTLLTIQALQDLNIPILAILLNRTAPTSENQTSIQQLVSTKEILQERTPVPILGPMEYLSHTGPMGRDFFRKLSETEWIIHLSDLLEKRMQGTDS